METGSYAAPAGGIRCSELEGMGLLDPSQCCEICHSADEYAPVGRVGPCRATLPDGREVFVCCEGKKQLLGKIR